MAARTFEALFQVLGSYLHQDWSDEFTSDSEALRAAVKGQSETQIKDAADDLKALLNEPLGEVELRKIMLHEASCYFDPAANGMTYREWLTHALSILESA